MTRAGKMEARRKAVLEMFERGVFATDMAAALGVSQTTVWRIRRDLGLPNKRGHPDRFRDDDFKSCHRLGLTDRMVAAQLGCSKYTAAYRRRRLGLPAHKDRRQTAGTVLRACARRVFAIDPSQAAMLEPLVAREMAGCR